MHPEPMRAQNRRLAASCDHAFASMTPPAASVSSRYPISKIAVSSAPRGTVNDTAANASVAMPASTNQRCRLNRLIHLYFMDERGDFLPRFRPGRLLSSPLESGLSHESGLGSQVLGFRPRS